MLIEFVIKSQVFLVISISTCMQFEICIDLCFFNPFAIRRLYVSTMLLSIKSYCDAKKTNSMFIHFDANFDDFAFSIFCSIFCCQLSLLTVKTYVAWKTESCQKHLQRSLPDLIELWRDNWFWKNPKSEWSWNFELKNLSKFSTKFSSHHVFSKIY